MKHTHKPDIAFKIHSTAQILIGICKTMNQCPELLEILNGVPHGIALLDQDLHIIEMNRFLEALTGYSGEEARGIYYDYVLRTHFQKNSPLLQQARETRMPVSTEGDTLGLNRKKNSGAVYRNPDPVYRNGTNSNGFSTGRYHHHSGNQRRKKRVRRSQGPSGT